MADLSDQIATAQQQLQDLCDLNDAAGDDPGLQAQIDAMTTQLGALRDAEAQADQASIDALGKALASVSDSLKAAQTDLTKLADVVKAVAGAVKIMASIATMAA